MIALSNRQQGLIALVLLTLVILTRGHHFASVNHLPSASWAVFFIAGIYLRPLWALPVLLTLSMLIDYLAISYGGVSDFCISPAYVLLIPAYSVLWLAGRWYARQHVLHWRTLIPLCIAALVGTLVCELFSSGGFYLFSGRFTEPSWTEFGTRLSQYFPPYLQSMGFYLAITTIIHLCFAVLRKDQTADVTL